jgi:hypothetical protein
LHNNHPQLSYLLHVRTVPSSFYFLISTGDDKADSN